MANKSMSRRQFLKTAGIAAAGTALGASGVANAARSTRYHPIAMIRQGPIELVHWSWLVASDGEVWQQMVDAFNEANTDIKIVMSVENADEYNTKVLAGVAAGNAPDFGWGPGGLRSQWINDGVLVPLDDLIASAGLDIADFTESSLRASRYPKFDNQTYMIPMDAMSLQMEVNTDHVAAAGLDIATPPNSAEALLEWAQAMTVRDGDTVTRSGIMMTGSGVQPTVTWGIVSHQMGFRRASDDLKTAAVIPKRAPRPRSGCSTCSTRTRSPPVTSPTAIAHLAPVRDRCSGPAPGRFPAMWTSICPSTRYPCRPSAGRSTPTSSWEGWSCTRRPTQGAMRRRWKPSSGCPTIASCGRRSGAAPRCATQSSPAKTTTPPAAWEVRGAFVEGMSFADILPVPVLAADDFEIYSGGNFLATTIGAVIAGEDHRTDDG
ncbi:MAG: extracellular solute-binding protein [Chloroflexi bacterium]|nr:extracellular solute-binding protein [Chloroflexota bacterium]